MSNAGFGFSLSMGRNGAIVGWKIIFMVWGASADGAPLIVAFFARLLFLVALQEEVFRLCYDFWFARKGVLRFFF